jgi:hypothetical protein
MYRRDFGVLVLSVFALWWSLQHEGAYEYRKAFYYNLPKQDGLSEYHKLPSPIVVRFCQKKLDKRIEMFLQALTEMFLWSMCCIIHSRMDVPGHRKRRPQAYSHAHHGTLGVDCINLVQV